MRRIRLWATGCAHPHMLHANSSHHKCRHRSHLSRHHHWVMHRSINRRSGKKSKICLTGRWILKSASLSYQVDFSILIRSIETADRVRRLDFCKKNEWRHQKISFSALKWNFSTRFGRALHDESNSTRARFHTVLLTTTTFTLQWARPPLIFLATISSFFLPKNSWFFVTS